MIRVTIQKIPFGVEENKQTLGVLEISNRHTWMDNHADYKVKEGHREWDIIGFDRERGVWDLLREALKEGELK